MLQHIDPVVCPIGMEKIRKNNFSCPNFSNLIFTFCTLNKYISFLSFLISIALSISNTWFDDRDEMIIICDFGHPIKGEFLLVYGESFIVLHIVNITPDIIKWDLILTIVLKNSFKSLNIFISPTTLMEA